MVFPLMTAAGGALLLTHSHAIANIKDQLLIELTHTPLALAGILAGWSRWLELRLDPPRLAHRRLDLAGMLRLLSDCCCCFTARREEPDPAEAT